MWLLAHRKHAVSCVCGIWQLPHRKPVKGFPAPTYGDYHLRMQTEPHPFDLTKVRLQAQVLDSLAPSTLPSYMRSPATNPVMVSKCSGGEVGEVGEGRGSLAGSEEVRNRDA